MKTYLCEYFGPTGHSAACVAKATSFRQALNIAQVIEKRLYKTDGIIEISLTEVNGDTYKTGFTLAKARRVTK